MKKLIALAFVLTLGFIASAQAWNGKGDQKIQVGLNGWGYGTGITGTYDYGIAKIVSVGAGINVYFDHNHNHKDDGDVFVFGRLGFHLQEPLGLPEKWDIYPGLNSGVRGHDFGIGGYVGVRYFFNSKVGVFLEAGNNGNLGVSFNL